MRNLIYILIFFISLGIKAQETFSIQGTVNSEKGEAIPGATVFIANSKKITATNEAGKFNISQLTPGIYELVVNMLGFNSYKQNITVVDNSVDIIIQLKESSIDLNTIVIKGKTDPSRTLYLQLFRQNFIGSSDNASGCKILNPEVLSLRYDRANNVLEASSNSFLTIENSLLGYRVNYLLKQFKLDSKNKILFYEGSIYFEELKGSDSQRKQWDNNRKLAYEGSVRHFFRAAFNNTLAQDEFVVYEKKALNVFIPLNADSIFSTVNKDFRLLNLKSPGELYIVYAKEREPNDFIRSGRSIYLKTASRIKQVSGIRRLLEDSILVDRNGSYPFKTLIAWGYWSWEGVADMLPLDYISPSADLQKALPNSIFQKTPQPDVLPQLAPLKTLIAAVDTLRSRLPIEKLYLQFDKPYYTTGDTLWFKAYLFDAARLSAAGRSNLVYVELANDTGKVLDRRMLSLSDGLGYGNIALSKEDIPQGSYTLRAYTNWMRNFGEDYVFKKKFYIGSPAQQNWLISSAIQQSKIDGKDNIRLALAFSQLDNRSLGLRPLQLRLMDGRKTLFKDQVQTSVDAKLDVNFVLPEKANVNKITLVAEDLAKGEGNRKIPIPILINRPENLDLQFMPEGGSMVVGLTSRIGFKAISEDGRGVELSGKVYSGSNSEVVAVFASLHKGIGSFELTPKAGESYTAKVNLPDGTTKSYPLPGVKNSGTVLRIKNTKESDSLELNILITPDLLTTTPSSATATYFLIGQSRGVVCYAARIILKSRESLRKIPKSAFPTGIARFTLFNSNNQPLNERIVYIDRNDELRISITPDKESYEKRDSIALAIEIKDKEGQPVHGSFSMAVTDDSQVRTDSIGTTILNNLLLSSDLKGTVEELGYYFNKGRVVARDLDNLLLTQGWVGYDPIAIGWKEVFNPITPVYAAEPEFQVRGRVLNVFNKSVAETGIRLLSTKPHILIDTVTDKKGTFSFRDFPPLDTAKFFIEARNRNDKSFNIGIEVDEFKPPVFKPSKERFIPWYLNSDTMLLKNINTKITEQKELHGGNVLDEVVITAKKIIKNSFNLNGPGEADLILDEKDMEKAGKKTLKELLEDLKGSYNIGGRYVLYGKTLVTIIDGIKSGVPNWLTAEDIKGIELMSTSKFMGRYMAKSGNLSISIVFIEITTRFGFDNIRYIKKTPGTYYYKSMPFITAKTFYRPKYIVRDTSVLIDLRSTIHWEPNVETDKQGKAMVSFYSADRPGTYTVILEGSDMNGNIGYQRRKINVNLKEQGAGK